MLLWTGANSTVILGFTLAAWPQVANGQKMYWADRAGGSPGSLSHANTDGSQVEQPITLPAPLGSAIDLRRGKMYWTDAGINMIQCAHRASAHISLTNRRIGRTPASLAQRHEMAGENERWMATTTGG